MLRSLTEEVEHLIEVKSISKDYVCGRQIETAIKHMDVAIDDGEFVAVIGQSGSGKSTLLSILGGLNKPTAGLVLIDGMNIYNLSSEQRADFRNEYIGIIFQSFQLISYLTILENVLLPLAITGLTRKMKRELAFDVIERVGLTDKINRLPDQISGGQQERAAIARALVNRPPVLLADEPTGNLDSETSRDVMSLLARLNEQDGLTVIMVTHSKENCDYAGRIITVKDGQIVKET